ncbi:MAG: hypothetical protein PHV42_00545 [Candidatus Pacebacteria bacterium]|nr:hypothetical protein [Candidatus Paceibacterota bacterium]
MTIQIGNNAGNPTPYTPSITLNGSITSTSANNTIILKSTTGDITLNGNIGDTTKQFGTITISAGTTSGGAFNQTTGTIYGGAGSTAINIDGKGGATINNIICYSNPANAINIGTGGGTSATPSVTLNGTITATANNDTVTIKTSTGDININGNIGDTTHQFGTITIYASSVSGTGSFIQAPGTTITGGAGTVSINIDARGSATIDGVVSLNAASTINIGQTNAVANPPTSVTFTGNITGNAIGTNPPLVVSSNGGITENSGANLGTSLLPLGTIQMNAKVSGTGTFLLGNMQSKGSSGHINVGVSTKPGAITQQSGTVLTLVTDSSGNVINLNATGAIGTVSVPMRVSLAGTTNNSVSAASTSSGGIYIDSAGALRLNTTTTASGSINIGTVNIPTSLLVIGSVTGGSGAVTMVTSGVMTQSAGTISTTGGANISLTSEGASTLQTVNSAGTLTLFKNSSAATYTIGTFTITSAGTFTISPGVTVTAGATTFNISGDWTDNGIFNAGTSAVNLTGTNQAIHGNTTFYDLTKTVSTARTLTFDASSTQTISHTLTLAGAVGQNLSLRSSSPGTQWNINPQGTRPVSRVDVQDSVNTNVTPINPANSVDSGNTVNWFTAAYLAITGSASMTAGGSQIITIKAYDSYNSFIMSYVGDKSMTFSGARTSVNPVVSPTASDKTSTDINFGSPTTVTFVAGVGTSTMKLYKAETAAINVTDGTVTATGHTLSVTVSVGPKSKLLFVTQPLPAVTVGFTWRSFSIQITDFWGNQTTDTDSITISPSSGSFASGTLTKSAIAGLATFNDITYGSPATITVSGSSGSLTPTGASISIFVHGVINDARIKISNATLKILGGNRLRITQ